MLLNEKLGDLSPEQHNKLLKIKSEAEFDTALSELGIEATAEEKAAVLEQIKSQALRELTDEEAEQATGGAWFQKCPHGKYEYFFYSPQDGCQNCTHFRFYENGIKLFAAHKDVVLCKHFNKTVYLDK